MTDQATDRPRCYVWQIEAFQDRNPQESSSQGSGVIVALRKKGEQRFRNYLITCAHVVKDPSKPSSPLKSNIVIHPSGHGFIPYKPGDAWPEAEDDGIFTGKVWDMLQRPDGAWNASERSQESDWVLIDVSEDSFQKQPAVRFSNPKKTKGNLDVIGYPNGISGLKTGNQLLPKWSKGLRLERASNQPLMLKLDGGDATGRGMSGGGLFDSSGDLAGIYIGQEREDETRYAIDIQAVLQCFDQNDYDYVVGRAVSEDPSTTKERNWKDLNRLIPYSLLGTYLIVVAVLSGQRAITPVDTPTPLLIFWSMIISFAAILLSWLMASRINNSKLITVAALTNIFLLCIVSWFYINLRQNNVHSLASNEPGFYVAVGYDNSPQSVHEHIKQAYPTESTKELLELFPPSKTDDVEEIWTKDSIAKTQKHLFWGWTSCLILGAWLAGLGVQSVFKSRLV
jgi:hypothetical protein